MFNCDWKVTLSVSLFLTISCYWLIDLARQGEPVAWIIIIALMVMLLTLLLVGGVIVLIKTIKTTEETAFLNNARENLAIMREMQLLQNAQTTGIARRNAQLERQLVSRLPPPDHNQPAVIFDAEIFEDLDD